MPQCIAHTAAPAGTVGNWEPVCIHPWSKGHPGRGLWRMRKTDFVHFFPQILTYTTGMTEARSEKYLCGGTGFCLCRETALRLQKVGPLLLWWRPPAGAVCPMAYCLLGYPSGLQLLPHHFLHCSPVSSSATQHITQHAFFPTLQASAIYW